MPLHSGTIATDKQLAEEHGMTSEAFHNHSTNVADHYGTIRQRLLERRGQFK
mgnify:FL=1